MAFQLFNVPHLRTPVLFWEEKNNLNMYKHFHWRTFWPELQRDDADRTASTGPALQVKAGVAGVDVSEDGLILVELGLCETKQDGV